MGRSPGLKDNEDSEIVESVALNAGDLNETTSLKNLIERERHSQTLQLRDRYSRIILWITAFQILFVNLLVVADGAGELWGNPMIQFHISDDLFKTYVISVFVTVVALAAVVTRNLFPGEPEGFFGKFLGFFRRQE